MLADATPRERNSFRVLYPTASSPPSLACPPTARSRFIHPLETTVTWIISIFAPAKVSQRDYRGATRFHPSAEMRRPGGSSGTG